VTHAYAVLRLKDGGADFDVMTRAEIDAIRKRSRAAARGPRVTDYAEMAKKTGLPPLPKTAPMAIEYQPAAAQDERGRTRLDLADLDVSPPISEEPEVVDGEVVAEAEPGDWPTPATPGGEA